MADQVAQHSEGGALAHEGHDLGRLPSWISVGLMIAGSTLGGIALTIGPSWLAFWIGTAVFIIGGLLAWATDIFADVTLDKPRVLPERSHLTPRHRAPQERSGTGPRSAHLDASAGS